MIPIKYKNIRSILTANRQHIGYLFILTLLMLVPSMVSPMYRKVFTDRILRGNAAQWMPILFLLMIGTALLSAVLSWMQNSCLLKLCNKIEMSGAARYFWNLLNAPLSFFDHKDSFVLLSKMEASKTISRIITRDMIELIFAVISVIFYLIMMITIDPFMALIVVALVVLNFLILKLKTVISERLSKAADNDDDETDELSADELLNRENRITSQTLQNIETYKSTASENFFFQRLMNNKTAVINSRLDDYYEDAYEPLTEFPEILFLNLLLVISALRIMDRSFTIGTYLAFQAYASAFFTPMNTVLMIRETLKDFEKKIGRLSQSELSAAAADEYQNPQPELHGGSLNRLSGRIEFDNVSFGYQEGQLLIKNFSLQIRPGERIAIIGKTGAGKTTLLKLLTGLCQPTAGCIKIDGRDVREIDRHLLANDIGYASQEIALFIDTIRNNITLWDESITGSDVYRAAGMAGIHEYITSLDDAYDSMLQENGSNLSGGQKQMLEIARAFLYEPTILIFDEALRSVDPAATQAIEREIAKKACTYIEVTHILSRQIAYDNIIVLEDGAIAAAGTHEELLQSCGYYAGIFHAEGKERA